MHELEADFEEALIKQQELQAALDESRGPEDSEDDQDDPAVMGFLHGLTG